ncbi:MAG TPA: periplasmic heavy metal sensor [Verrucomicrobiae bacterium]|nr:periplasmic heavy metal sensor [Verrucomicrobiae bacterium]
MNIYSKAALGLLALTLSCVPALAQGDPQDPPPAQPETPDGPGGGPGGPMWSGHNGGGWGQGGGWGHRRGGWNREDRMGGREFGFVRLLNDPAIRQQVGVTDEEAAKIRQQTSDFMKKEIQDRANVAVQRIDLRDLLAAEKPDRAAIDSKLQDISTSRLAMEKSAVDYRLTLRDEITPAQRDKIRELMRDRWSRDRGEGGRWQRGPHGGRRGGQRGPGPGAAPAPNAPSNPQGGAAPGN